jgi:hypothetical protein
MLVHFMDIWNILRIFYHLANFGNVSDLESCTQEKSGNPGVNWKTFSFAF